MASFILCLCKWGAGTLSMGRLVCVIFATMIGKYLLAVRNCPFGFQMFLFLNDNFSPNHFGSADDSFATCFLSCFEWSFVAFLVDFPTYYHLLYS